MKLKTIFWLATFICLICSSPALALANTEPLNFMTIDDYVEREMRSAQIPGLALGIVHGNKIVYLKGYGTADNNMIPVTPQTPFFIGSVGKTMTALAIRQLENKGMIDINEPVTKYILSFHAADSIESAKITVKDLLNHTSGFSNQSGNEPFLYNNEYSLEELIKKLEKVRLNRPVGQHFEYSNINYLILGLIIEKVTGLSYDDYIQQNIFEGIQMEHSYLSEQDALQAGLAQGHRIVYGSVISTHVPYPTGHIPSGYQISTAEDMAKYLTCYLNNGYYNGQSIIPNNELTSLNEPLETYNTKGLYYDSIWRLKSGYPTDYNGFYGFVGATPNFNAVMLISQETKYGIVVLANCRDVYTKQAITSQTIGNGITDIILGKGVPPQQKPQGDYTKMILPGCALLILTVRTISGVRFKRNISTHGKKRIISILVLVVIDIILPLIVLMVFPIYFDNSWSYFIGSNPEFGGVLFISSIVLLALAAAKIIMLLRIASRW